MTDQLRIPEDLYECYEACLAVEREGCGEHLVDAKTEIMLIGRIARITANLEQREADVTVLMAKNSRLEAQLAARTGPLTDAEKEEIKREMNWCGSDFLNHLFPLIDVVLAKRKDAQ